MKAKAKTTKKASAKKAPAKKVTAKKAPTKKATAKKVVPAKKSAVKKATAKKVAPAKKVTPAKKVKSSNKELDKMLKTIEKAKKAKESSVVVYTTSREDHPTASSGGFGFQDLKPSLQEAYKKIMCQFNLRTNMVNASEKKVEWIVDL